MAFYNAVTDGAKKFFAIAIYTPNQPVTPCGICRQVMSEFCGDDFIIISASDTQTYNTYTLEELLPHAFKLKDN